MNSLCVCVCVWVVRCNAPLLVLNHVVCVRSSSAAHFLLCYGWKKNRTIFSMHRILHFITYICCAHELLFDFVYLIHLYRTVEPECVLQKLKHMYTRCARRRAGRGAQVHKANLLCSWVSAFRNKRGQHGAESQFRFFSSFNSKSIETISPESVCSATQQELRYTAHWYITESTQISTQTHRQTEQCNCRNLQKKKLLNKTNKNGKTKNNHKKEVAQSCELKLQREHLL